MILLIIITHLFLTCLKATGPTIGLAISSLVTAVGCLSVAYISGWKLSIVITIFVPFIVVAGSLSMLLLGGKARYGGDEESGQVTMLIVNPALHHVNSLKF